MKFLVGLLTIMLIESELFASYGYEEVVRWVKVENSGLYTKITHARDVVAGLKAKIYAESELDVITTFDQFLLDQRNKLCYKKGEKSLEHDVVASLILTEMTAFEKLFSDELMLQQSSRWKKLKEECKDCK